MPFGSALNPVTIDFAVFAETYSEIKTEFSFCSGNK